MVWSTVETMWLRIKEDDDGKFYHTGGPLQCSLSEITSRNTFSFKIALFNICPTYFQSLVPSIEKV